MGFLESRRSTGQPHIDRVVPSAAMPGGLVALQGTSLACEDLLSVRARLGDAEARTSLVRPTEVVVRVPEGSISGEVTVQHAAGESNGSYLHVAVPMAENLHPIANPAVDVDGNVYATVSGQRGQQVPVSIFRIERDFQTRPFVRDLLNASGLAFGPGGDLYVSSRAEGTVYRVRPNGEFSVFAEGLGLATGLAFDPEGNLFVGDRSGTIFKIAPDRGAPLEHTDREIFVFATLEPSIAAYHLAFHRDGRLFVSGPTTSSSQTVHAVDHDGTVRPFMRGLGRAQGMAFAADGSLLVAASYRGDRGLVRLSPDGEASLALSGPNLVGLAFLDDGCAALATRDALFHVELEIEGQPLPFSWEKDA